MMRKIRLAIVGAACLMAAGCPGGCDPIELIRPEKKEVTAVTVSPATAQLPVGQTVQFAATVQPASAPNKTVTWSITPQASGTIDANGILTAFVPGQVTVAATSNATNTVIGTAFATIIPASAAATVSPNGVSGPR